MGKILKFKKRNQKLSFIVLSFLGLAVLFNNCSQPGDIQLSGELAKGSVPSSDDKDGEEPQDPGSFNSTPPVPSAPNSGSHGNMPPPSVPLKYKQVMGSLDVRSIENNKVDILVVIDNSGSMNYEQTEMANRFSGFISSLDGLDWQLSITTTDVRTDKSFSDGKLLAFDTDLYKLTSNDDPEIANTLFAKIIQRPADEGSGREQGVRATYRAIQRAGLPNNQDPTRNTELFREGASLAVVIVTDADETPFDSGLIPENDPLNLLAYIKERWPQKVATFHSIIVQSGDMDCLKDKTNTNENESYGVSYETLSRETSGIVGTVCAVDYTGQLKIIGQNIKDKVNSIKLECAPVDSDKDGKVNVAIKDSASNILNNYNVENDVVSFTDYLAVGKYSMEYTCIDPN